MNNVLHLESVLTDRGDTVAAVGMDSQACLLVVTGQVPVATLVVTSLTPVDRRNNK